MEELIASLVRAFFGGNQSKIGVLAKIGIIIGAMIIMVIWIWFTLN